MKKLLLGLGSVAATIAPVAAVVACGDDKKTPAPAQTPANTPAPAKEVAGAKVMAEVSTAINALNTQTGTVAIHYVLGKGIEYSSFGTTHSDSAEVSIYKENGTWKVSHSATWALPFFKHTGVWVMSGTAPTEAEVTTGLNDLAAFKKVHHSKDLSFVDVQRIQTEMAKAMADGKIVLQAGDKVVINNLKHDSNSYKDSKGTHALGTDHLGLVAGAAWSRAFNLK